MNRDDEYIELLRSKLSAKRFTHSLNVADSAKYLAEKYGGDVRKAYTAGLLHDIMKDTDANGQLQIIKKADIILSQCEMFNAKLWHAISGAAYVSCELGLDDEDIVSAIRYHTTGRAGMSLLEKIIYIADYISADRTYDGIEKMRGLSEKSLEDAMYFGLEFTITDLAGKGFVIHPDSVNCFNELIIGRYMNRQKN